MGASKRSIIIYLIGGIVILAGIAMSDFHPLGLVFGVLWFLLYVRNLHLSPRKNVKFDHDSGEWKR